MPTHIVYGGPFSLKSSGRGLRYGEIEFWQGWRERASCTRAPFHPITTENAISERNIRFFRSPNTVLAVVSIFRATCIRSNVSLVLRSNLPIYLSSPGKQIEIIKDEYSHDSKES